MVHQHPRLLGHPSSSSRRRWRRGRVVVVGGGSLFRLDGRSSEEAARGKEGGRRQTAQRSIVLFPLSLSFFLRRPRVRPAPALLEEGGRSEGGRDTWRIGVSEHTEASLSNMQPARRHAVSYLCYWQERTRGRDGGAVAEPRRAAQSSTERECSAAQKKEKHLCARVRRIFLAGSVAATRQWCLCALVTKYGLIWGCEFLGDTTALRTGKNFIFLITVILFF